MSDRFTVVFKGDIRAFDGNPLHIVSPFGEVVAGGIGDEFAVADALRAENARLFAALKCIDDIATTECMKNDAGYSLRLERMMEVYKAARAAMGESDD